MKRETMQVAGHPRQLHGETNSGRPFLSKQMLFLETPRDKAWERRRRQILHQERKKEEIFNNNDESDLTDEDMRELKACIELGFGFCEGEAYGVENQKLSNTIPALDLYFAVNREKTKERSSPMSILGMSSSSQSSSTSLMGSPSSSLGYSPMRDSDVWNIFNPGDDPKLVKTKLRHWAQAVACSVMQSQ